MLLQQLLENCAQRVSKSVGMRQASKHSQRSPCLLFNLDSATAEAKLRQLVALGAAAGLARSASEAHKSAELVSAKCGGALMGHASTGPFAPRGGLKFS